PLEIREMGVHGGRRRKPHGLPDLAHRRRVAVPVDVVEDEAPDLSLAGRQFRAGLHLTLRDRGTVPNVCSPLGYGLLRTASIGDQRKGRLQAAWDLESALERT